MVGEKGFPLGISTIYIKQCAQSVEGRKRTGPYKPLGGCGQEYGGGPSHGVVDIGKNIQGG